MNNKDLTPKDTKKSEERSLFDRVIQILEQTRANVVRTVNSSIVTAYWLIGREIVLELQGGDERAEYGKQVMENLSTQLTQKYGLGFSVANLKNFRQFYATYADCLAKKSYPSGSESGGGFNPQLSWSHYRALMRVAKPEVRIFYEKEAAECGWSKVQLERQIQTSYYERILKNRGHAGLLPANRERLPGDAGHTR